MRYTIGLLAHLSQAGEWFLRSGIQETSGGVARYYDAGQQRNRPVSTEITGYAISALTYLHSLTNDSRYLDQAIAAARFLTRTAWDPISHSLPFELDPPQFAYFFDCGIVVRGLIAVWRASGIGEFLKIACAVGRSMATDFDSADGPGFHPILSLPDKQPLPHEPARWSRSPGCYQLKAAMAWWDLAEATGETHFRERYEGALANSLQTWRGFLPGHSERPKVMDRLHAFLYFLEGLLPQAHDSHCASVLCAGIRAVAHYLQEIAPECERADVYAQVLRIRVYADWAGVSPLDRDRAQAEADRLAQFQVTDPDPRLAWGFRFGRSGDTWSPHVSPVPTAFAVQALALWESWLTGDVPASLHLLI